MYRQNTKNQYFTEVCICCRKRHRALQNREIFFFKCQLISECYWEYNFVKLDHVENFLSVQKGEDMVQIYLNRITVFKVTKISYGFYITVSQSVWLASMYLVCICTAKKKRFYVLNPY